MPSDPHEQGPQVVAGVVLEHARQVGDDAAVGQHGLDADHLRPRHPVRHHMDAAGVRRDGAADGGRVTGGEVDAVGPARIGRMTAHVAERGSRADRHLPREVVDLPQRVEPTGRQDDRQRPGCDGRRHRSADEAGVAALGDDGDAEGAARGEDTPDLLGRGGADDQCRGAPPPTRPVGHVLLHERRLGEDVLRAHDVAERSRQRSSVICGVGHGVILAEQRGLDHRRP